MKKYPTVLKKYMSICHPPTNVEKIATYLFHVKFFHIETEERLFDMDMINFEGGGVGLTFIHSLKLAMMSNQTSIE